MYKLSSYVLLFLFASTTACTENLATGVLRITSEKKLVAGYMGKVSSDVIEEMSQNGMNCALVKFGYYGHPSFPEEGDQIKKWANLCQEHNMMFVPVLNLWHRERDWIEPENYLYTGGIRYNRTPCPLDETFYTKAIHVRVLELAEMSRSVPIAGIVFDLEMYGAEIDSYRYLCFCDSCYERFVGHVAVVGSEYRESIVRSHGQTDGYRKRVVQAVQEMAQDTCIEVKRLAPEVFIGFLDLDLPGAFNTGLARGFSGPNRAVYIFTEQTYKTGYSDYLRRTKGKYASENIGVRLIAGLWQTQFPTENLAEQYYYCARGSDGYWIYTLESLSRQSQSTLPAGRKYYWEAIKQANEELAKLENDPAYCSELRIRPFSVPLVKTDFSKIEVKPTRYVNRTRPVRWQNRPVAFRFRGDVVFNAELGEHISFSFTYQKKSNAVRPYVVTTLISDKSEVLVQDRAFLMGGARLDITAPYTGTYVIDIDTHGNVANLVECSHLYSIDVKSYVDFVKPRSELYLYKQQGDDPAKILIWVDGPGESITATFRDEQGSVLGIHDVIGRQEIALPMKVTERGRIIQLSIKPRPGTHYEDVRIQNLSGLVTYISPYKDGLMRLE